MQVAGSARGVAVQADLVTKMVGDSPAAGHNGRVTPSPRKPEEVAAAIEDTIGRPHPAVSARHLAGAVVAVADKMDTICGCFQADLVPPVPLTHTLCGGRGSA
jgi:glycyl-tRNA synthetase beta chain